MADHLAANETVMRAMAQLDFDGRETTRDRVEASLDAAIVDGEDDFDSFDAFDRESFEAVASDADAAVGYAQDGDATDLAGHSDATDPGTKDTNAIELLESLLDSHSA